MPLFEKVGFHWAATGGDVLANIIYKGVFKSSQFSQMNHRGFQIGNYKLGV